MYSLSKNRNGVSGTDNRGNTRLLFDTSDVYRNKGQLPLHDLKKNPDGSATAVDVISDIIFKRYEQYKTITETDTEAAGFLAADFLLADKLITRPDPVKAALIDLPEKESALFHNSIGFFNNENLILDINSSARTEVFIKHGFDIVVIAASDLHSEQQLRTAANFLSERGMLLMLLKNSPVFEKMAELFLQNAEKIEIDENFMLLISGGNGDYRDWTKEVDLDREYEKLCEKVHASGDIKGKEYTDLLISINNLINESQKQWNLPKKQAFIDLKEEVERLI